MATLSNLSGTLRELGHPAAVSDAGPLVDEISKSVVTCMAGFAASAPASTGMAAFPGPKSAVTSMAGFAGGFPVQPAGRTATPAARRYSPPSPDGCRSPAQSAAGTNPAVPTL
jgi:hypothetical protein